MTRNKYSPISQWVRPAGAYVALLLGVSAPAAGQLQIESLTTTLYRVWGGGAGNVLISTGESGTVLVDTHDASAISALDSILTEQGVGDVRVVINTHYHADHIGGNPHFRSQGAVIIAHENLANQASKDTVIADWQGWERKAAPPDAMPVVSFYDSIDLHLNNELMTVFHVDSAHTDGDAIVRFHNANVIHTGDVFELGAPPFIDWWAGGTLGGMVAAVNLVIEMADADTRIVPGHGPVSDRNGLRNYRDMLVTVGARVRHAVANGQTMDALLETAPTAEFDAALGGARRGGQLITLLYYGLSRRSSQ